MLGDSRCSTNINIMLMKLTVISNYFHFHCHVSPRINYGGMTAVTQYRAREPRPETEVRVDKRPEVMIILQRLVLIRFLAYEYVSICLIYPVEKVSSEDERLINRKTSSFFVTFFAILTSCRGYSAPYMQIRSAFNRQRLQILPFKG